jgi:hypothetical protein
MAAILVQSPPQKRVSYNGITPASQADYAGSIPATRSRHPSSLPTANRKTKNRPSAGFFVFAKHPQQVVSNPLLDALTANIRSDLLTAHDQKPPAHSTKQQQSWPSHRKIPTAL